MNEIPNIGWIIWVIILCILTYGIGYCVGWLKWQKSHKLLAEALQIAKDGLIAAHGRAEVAHAGWLRIAQIAESRLTPQELQWTARELAKTGDPNFLREMK